MKKRGLFHYWENKIIKIWIPSLIILIGLSLAQGKMFIAWLPKYPVALKGNLMYVIFGGYAVFWCIFKYISNKTARILCIFGAFVGAFAFLPESFSGKAPVAGWLPGSNSNLLVCCPSSDYALCGYPDKVCILYRRCRIAVFSGMDAASHPHLWYFRPCGNVLVYAVPAV